MGSFATALLHHYATTSAPWTLGTYSTGITTESVRNGFVNCTASPAAFPGMGNNRAESGLCSLTASAATSPTSAASTSTETSPGRGATPRPGAQKAEKGGN